MSVSFAQILQRTRALTPVHAAGAARDIFAFQIAGTTLEALVRPSALEPGGGFALSELVDPLYLGAEALFSVLMGAWCLLIWEEQTGEARAPIGPVLAPLVVLSILVAWAWYLGLMLLVLPAILVSALTFVLVPVIVIERRDWGALGYAVNRAMPAFPALVAVSALLLLVWYVTLGITLAWVYAAVDAGPVTLWLRWLVADGVASLIGAAALMFTMGAYLELSGDDPAVGDVFR